MTANDEPLRDFLRQFGFEHVTPFHVRSLDVFRSTAEALRIGPEQLWWTDGFFGRDPTQRRVQVFMARERLLTDLASGSMDIVHLMAIDEDNFRLVRKPRKRKAS